MFSALFKANLFLQFFGFTRIPLIWYVGAKLIEMSENRTVIFIPLSRRTKNHLGSMYFGALAIGADVTGAWLAFDRLRAGNERISVVFKDMQGEFLRRADGDVHFVCEDGLAVYEALNETVRTKQRVNVPVTVNAFVPKHSKTEPVAVFRLTLSAKAAG